MADPRAVSAPSGMTGDPNNPLERAKRYYSGRLREDRRTSSYFLDRFPITTTALVARFFEESGEPRILAHEGQQSVDGIEVIVKITFTNQMLMDLVEAGIITQANTKNRSLLANLVERLFTERMATALR